MFLVLISMMLLLTVFIAFDFFGIVYIILFIGALYLRNTHSCKLQIAREEEMYGQREILILIDNGITAINEKTGGSQHFDFSQISKFKQTKNLLILITRSKNHLIFRKDSFTIGTYGDFVNFLNACYPHFHLGQKGTYDRDRKT